MFKLQFTHWVWAQKCEASFGPMPLTEFELEHEAMVDPMPLPLELVTFLSNKSTSIQSFILTRHMSMIHFKSFWRGHLIRNGDLLQFIDKVMTNIQSNHYVQDFLWCHILKLEDEFSPTRGELMGTLIQQAIGRSIGAGDKNSEIYLIRSSSFY